MAVTDGEHTPESDAYESDLTYIELGSNEEGLSTSSSGPARGKRNNDRANVRRIAAKFGEIQGASAEHLELLSTALGVPNTTVDLTVAVIAGGKSGLAGLTDVVALSEPMDPYDGMVAAISLGRARIKAVWAVLLEMGSVTGPVPASDVKAGGAIAKATGNISQENLDEITSVLALAKK